MYRELDKVLKKSVRFGVCKGFVINAWTTIEGTEYIRVKWDHDTRSTCKADSVLPATPENATVREQKRAKLDAKYNKATQ